MKKLLVCLSAALLSCATVLANPEGARKHPNPQEQMSLLGKTEAELQQALGNPSSTQSKGCRLEVPVTTGTEEITGDFWTFDYSQGSQVNRLLLCVYKGQVVAMKMVAADPNASPQYRIYVEAFDTKLIQKLLSASADPFDTSEKMSL